MRRIYASLFVAFVTSLWIVSAGVAFAQDGTSTTAAAAEAPPARKPPPGFAPVKGAPDTSKVDPSPLVVAAYATFFLGMFGYLIYVVRQQSQIAKEMADLAARIDRAESK